ncbi:MAG: folate family ECF transporter S component [Lachnospiraceae bacterium]|nr:folate family ECF transporter S component [Lachnospiraceae bacterium]
MDNLSAENKKTGIGKQWVDSLRELRRVRALTMCGMMAALAIVLNFVASIDLGQYIRIGFSGVPNQIVAYLFGPAVGTLFGGVLDVLKFFVKPTGPFFPGFTLSAALGGMIYGIMLYHRPLSLRNVFLAQLIVKIVINIGLNTVWLKILYDKAILVILPGRMLSNAIMLPIDTLLTYVILKVMEQAVLPHFRTDLTKEQ